MRIPHESKDKAVNDENDERVALWQIETQRRHSGSPAINNTNQTSMIPNGDEIVRLRANFRTHRKERNTSLYLTMVRVYV